MKGETVLTTAEGNTTSLLPHPTADSETLICQAKVTLSQLYISASVLLPVATLSDVYITGPDTVTMGQKTTFICFATCTPKCDYTWTFRGHTYIGDLVELRKRKVGKPQYCSKLVMTFDEYSNTVPLVCQVKNVKSQAVLSATKELTLIDPISVRPISEARPVSGKPFSLRCVGAKNPGGITWQMNGRAITTSENVHLSSDGLTLAFSRLQQAHSGLYQCLVSEGGDPILSVGYNLTVIYGPLEVAMVNHDKGPVGSKMFALLGSKTELQCVADCSPPCGFAWYYRGAPISTNASLLFTPTTPTSNGGLTCVAYNRVTSKNMTSYTTVVVPGGPGNVTILGPESVEVGVTASFRCSAECIPPCSYTWSVYGKPMVGSEIEVTLSRYVSAESISCQAENTVSGKMATVNETLQVSDPLWCGC
ncbi:kin of IRRE-like protein 2 [Genypterus blacodes]|uniref:kin of IRRE-like protein 2 n=1 Tax=Genypterus blacodes TaxID=154954 RepID=UPI003F76E2EC